MARTPKRFTVVRPTDTDTTIPFELVDQNGESLGVFHASSRPRFDLVNKMTDVVERDVFGQRIFRLPIIEEVLYEMLAKERFDEERGEWIATDDEARLRAIIESDRVVVTLEQLGQIMMDVLSETTGHPTSGSKPSVPGPAQPVMPTFGAASPPATSPGTKPTDRLVWTPATS